MTDKRCSLICDLEAHLCAYLLWRAYVYVLASKENYEYDSLMAGVEAIIVWDGYEMKDINNLYNVLTLMISCNWGCQSGSKHFCMRVFLCLCVSRVYHFKRYTRRLLVFMMPLLNEIFICNKTLWLISLFSSSYWCRVRYIRVTWKS